MAPKGNVPIGGPPKDDFEEFMRWRQGGGSQQFGDPVGALTEGVNRWAGSKLNLAPQDVQNLVGGLQGQGFSLEDDSSRVSLGMDGSLTLTPKDSNWNLSISAPFDGNPANAAVRLGYDSRQVERMRLPEVGEEIEMPPSAGRMYGDQMMDEYFDRNPGRVQYRGQF